METMRTRTLYGIWPVKREIVARATFINQSSQRLHKRKRKSTVPLATQFRESRSVLLIVVTIVFSMAFTDVS